MSEQSLAERAATIRAKMEGENPTANPAVTPAARKRIPLSVPQRKLEVPGIPGYHLRWIRGTAQRLLQAQNAGFEFVASDEVGLNNVLLGGDATKSGNDDMGSRVSVAEGGEVEDGQAVRLYLMKQPLEYYLEDKQIIQDRNDSVAQALTNQFKKGTVGGTAQGETSADAANRYVDTARTKLPGMFRKKNSA